MQYTRGYDRRLVGDLYSFGDEELVADQIAMEDQEIGGETDAV